MAAYICRMCGGALELINKGVCRCEYCGNWQSVPQIDDDDKAELCTVAERFRKKYQYDKAIEIYEKLLKIYPTDADLYWSMLLCRYGVEYQEQKCTLNRTQPRSLLADEDYKTALKYATSEQRNIMESQAAEIDRIRRGIVESALGCKEYDVYLCCNEFDENGRRTRESVIASSLFSKLANEGFRVFFAQITLEDILTSEWEQHIYAALNSAKVMVIVGTSKESFENIWVKNAWVRYLSLMNGERKTVIPTFRNIDACELPAELSYFQALDMARLGFERDLVSSIRGVIAADNIVQRSENHTKDDPLLRRAYVHLQEGEFSEVCSISDQLLKTQGESAEIYLVKLLAEYKVTSENALDLLETDFSYSENYRRAMQLGDEGFRLKLREHNNRSAYNKFVSQLESAESETQCLAAAEGFRALGEYADSDEKVTVAENKAKQLKEQAEHKDRENIYALCVKNLNESTDLNVLRSVEHSLNKLGDYKDSADLADKCAVRIRRISAEKVFSADMTDDKTSSTAKKRKPMILAASICSVAVIAIIIAVALSNGKDDIISDTPSETIISATVDADTAVTEAILPSEKEKEYQAATLLLDNGDYDEAITAFGLLGDYADSAEKVLEAKYQKADKLLADGNYDDAELIFTVLGGYSDSSDRIDDCKSARGTALFEEGELEIAESIFLEIQDYARLNEVRYKQAELALESGNKNSAKELFRNLGNYSDSRQNYCELAYEEAEQLVKNGSYDQALLILKGITDYPDKLQLLKLCNYYKAKQYADSKDYENAIKLYEELGEYSDAALQLWSARYDYAVELAENKKYDDALALLNMLGNNSDVQRLKHSIAVKNLYNGNSFTFGSYEQDGDTSNGSEPINWIVMGRGANNEVYLISEKVLAVSSFGTLSWNDCPLRDWLNNEFYNTAFNSIEKEYLHEYTYYPSVVETSGNMRLLWPRRDMDKYVDKVFIPQISYIDFYMKGENASAAPTQAVQTELNTSKDKVEWWCVSELGMLAYSIDADGNYIKRIQNDDCRLNLGVRPVIVISSESQ